MNAKESNKELQRIAHKRFVQIAANWFGVDRATIEIWIKDTRKPCSSLVHNLHSVFEAGFLLGIRHRDES